MKNPVKLLLSINVLLAAVATAHAGAIYTSTSSLTAWDGTPTYTSVANASLSGANVNQGSATITGSYGVLAEMFTPGAAFTLDSFNVLFAVNSPTTYQIHLFDLGPAGTVSVNSTAATYTPGTDLFSGLSIGLSTTGGEVQGKFTLTGSDQVTLLANEQYALEFWTPSAAGAAGVVWYRGSSVDPGGQMFTGADSALARKTLAGNGQAGGAPRTAALALYAVVPEPSCFALAGMGLAAMIAFRRRNS